MWEKTGFGGVGDVKWEEPAVDGWDGEDEDLDAEMDERQEREEEEGLGGDRGNEEEEEQLDESRCKEGREISEGKSENSLYSHPHCPQHCHHYHTSDPFPSFFPFPSPFQEKKKKEVVISKILKKRESGKMKN